MQTAPCALGELGAHLTPVAAGGLVWSLHLKSLLRSPVGRAFPDPGVYFGFLMLRVHPPVGF